MKKELSRLRKLSNTDNEFGTFLNELKPFVELAKIITKSPVCEISLNDRFTRWSGPPTEKKLKIMPREERMRHPLIGSDGSHMGAIRVYGRKPNRDRYPSHAAKEEDKQQEKKQLDQLAHLITDYVERENKYNTLSDKLDVLKTSLNRLNHDIRSPIAGIVGIADILIHDEQAKHDEQANLDDQSKHDIQSHLDNESSIDDLSKLPKEGLTMINDLSMIKDSAQTIIERIDEVLNKMDAGSGIELDKTTLRSVIVKIQRLYNPLAQQKNHSLLVKNYVNGELPIPHQLSCMLKQSIGNLVANAIKFTPENGSITIIFSHSTVKGKDMLHVEVDDDGKGMTSEQILSFNSGKTVEQSKGTAGEESFGMGLAHTRQLVTEHKGFIAAKEHPGRGASFFMALPLSGVDGL